VSFSDATVIGTAAAADDDHRRAVMQDDGLTSSCRANDPISEISDNGERETFYDIWQADDSSVGKSDDGYSESTPRFDNYAENHCASSYVPNNNGTGKHQRSHPGNVDLRSIEGDARARGGWASSKGDVCPANRLVDSRTKKVDEDDTAPNENPKDADSIGCKDEHRMRGGCGGCCCGASRERSVNRCRSALLFIITAWLFTIPSCNFFGIKQGVNPL